jgi:proteasome accessory factor A
LVLRALQVDDADPAAVALASPVDAFHKVSRDLTLRAGLELRNGKLASALDIQHWYRELVQRALPGPNDAALTERWGAVLDGLATDPASQAHQVEWVAKYQVLDALRRRRSLDWAAPQLRAGDLRWTDVGSPNSLFHRLEAAGGVERLFTEPEIAQAVAQPPDSTRAYLRGEAIRRLGAGVVSAAWDRLTLTWPGGAALVEMPDPMGASRQRLGVLDDSLDAAGLAAALEAGL